jgi:hypothetical protein
MPKRSVMPEKPVMLAKFVSSRLIYNFELRSKDFSCDYTIYKSQDNVSTRPRLVLTKDVGKGVCGELLERASMVGIWSGSLG